MYKVLRIDISDFAATTEGTAKLVAFYNGFSVEHPSEDLIADLVLKKESLSGYNQILRILEYYCESYKLKLVSASALTVESQPTAVTSHVFYLADV